MHRLFRTASKAAMVFASVGMIACSGSKSADSEFIGSVEAYEKAFETAAQTKGDGNPALWKLADEDTTIYIYGTFHLLPASTDWQTEEFQQALASADTVYLEIDMSAGNEAIMQQKLMTAAMFSDGRKLKDVMSAEQYSNFETLAEERGLPAAAVEGFKPWFVGLQIQVMELVKAGYDPTKGVEKVILDKIKDQNIPIGSLETIEDQIEALTGGSDATQVASLLFGLETLNSVAGSTDLLLEEWADGDVVGLGALMGDPALFGSQEAYDALLVNRNRNWIPEIEAILNDPGVKFIAVGAGHLAGPDSVIRMLEDKGYKVATIQ